MWNIMGMAPNERTDVAFQWLFDEAVVQIEWVSFQVQKLSKVCAYIGLGGPVDIGTCQCFSQLDTMAAPLVNHSPWPIHICPQAIEQLTLLFPTLLRYSRQRQTTTRLSLDKIYEPIHWLPSWRVTIARLTLSWVYFESKHNLSISFATAMTSWSNRWRPSSASYSHFRQPQEQISAS